MKNFFLLVIIISGFNLFAQQYSGEGVYLTFENGITVKWSNTSNNVMTKTASYSGEVEMDFQKYSQYKINNSTNYFLLQKVVFGDGYWVYLYNELGSLYWKAQVYKD